ncbi:hypothetical protein OHT59_28420 [Streptomyces sp. NBC_00243]|uniref:hypothetical protein n=1 Tax=Streptomyces sp. NBC_00243 TaxID=2975688 RepID=UPI002DD8DC7C|nr:hypothetical protein [Streptomyces sp. NBC_00243]WRZ22127.1 hypothetical protein OHT59_28420 [Streptomyces sp. NBC_00243]
MVWPEAAGRTSSWPLTQRQGSSAERAPEPERELLSGFESDPGPEHPGPIWEQDDPGHTHDPHEVTIQLDGAGRQLEDWLVQQAKDAPTAQDGSDGPVFVDESGRRSRRYRRLGVVVGLACAAYAVVILVTLLSGNSNAPWIPVPGQQEDQPAGQVDTSPLPAETVSPTGTGSASPGASATASDGTTPAPGANPTPDASGTAANPGTSTDPKPSTSATTSPDPGTSTTPDPDPEPTATATNSPDPTPTDTATTPAPSDSPVTGGDSGAVAEGVVEQNPVAIIDPEPSTASSSSPENNL